MAESPSRSAPGEAAKRGLKLQQQESVATIMQPLNTNLNNGQHYANFMQQLAQGTTDLKSLTARLESLVERRKLMLETLYSTTANASLSFETRISDLQKDVQTLLLDCKQVLASARQLCGPGGN